jgi:tRNA(fMet)-specific endonuclease VapC
VTLQYLVDASTLSWVVAPKPNKKVVRRLARDGASCAIAAPVWHELTCGCGRLAPGKRRTERLAFLRDVVNASFPVLPYDEHAATWHGSERARLEKLGRPVPFVDAQIAAIARIAGLILVTANPKDFRRFRDLKVEDWT